MVGKIWIQRALDCCKTHVLMRVITQEEIKNPQMFWHCYVRCHQLIILTIYADPAINRVV